MRAQMASVSLYAPRFAPYAPNCARREVIRPWQYGQSTTNANQTDVDEIVRGTPGLITPDGAVT